jgi:catechol 2,3-dioxygenase-like lactoylglutathione lyase family enzyme
MVLKLSPAIPVLHVTNARTAVDFYRKLGFVLLFGAPDGVVPADPCYVGIMRDGAVLHLSSHAGDGAAGGVVYVMTEDVDRLHEELRGRNVAVHLGPIDQTWGMREMYVRDPDGNSIRFGQRIAGT